jgi:hypothetical protein
MLPDGASTDETLASATVSALHYAMLTYRSPKKRAATYDHATVKQAIKRALRANGIPTKRSELARDLQTRSPDTMERISTSPVLGCTDMLRLCDYYSSDEFKTNAATRAVLELLAHAEHSVTFGPGLTRGNTAGMVVHGMAYRPANATACGNYGLELASRRKSRASLYKQRAKVAAPSDGSAEEVGFDMRAYDDGAGRGETEAAEMRSLALVFEMSELLSYYPSKTKDGRLRVPLEERREHAERESNDARLKMAMPRQQRSSGGMFGKARRAPLKRGRKKAIDYTRADAAWAPMPAPLPRNETVLQWRGNSPMHLTDCIPMLASPYHAVDVAERGRRRKVSTLQHRVQTGNFVACGMSPIYALEWELVYAATEFRVLGCTHAALPPSK